MTATEAKLKIAELAAEVLKQHMQTCGKEFQTVGSVTSAFNQIYSAIHDKIAKSANSSK